MTRFFNRLARFCRNESGAPTVEFAIVFPVIMAILAASVELSVINLRQTALESRLDQAMRTVRINTGAMYSHDDVRDMICENASLFGNCQANLRLEMIPSDPRAYTQLPDNVDCVNRSVSMDHSANAIQNFHLGNANELVIVRACLIYDPIIPTSLMALSRTQDSQGGSALVAVSAFTQEPR